MDPDDELCLCFHVTQRKVVNFLRIERPRRVSQLSACGGAGTGCGWCRPFLARLFDAWSAQQATGDRPATPGAEFDVPPDLPDAGDYSQQRAAYVRRGGGTPPPGATPIDEGG